MIRIKFVISSECSISQTPDISRGMTSVLCGSKQGNFIEIDVVLTSQFPQRAPVVKKVVVFNSLLC